MMQRFWERGAGRVLGMLSLWALLVAGALAGCGGEETAEQACKLDAECPRGQVCGGGVCDAVPCLSSLDCPGGSQACLASGTCGAIECFTDEDCELAGLGNVCQEEACFEGEGCTTREDCSAGQICNTLSGVCTAPPTRCSSDAECPVGEYCDAESERCAEGEGPANNNPANNNPANNNPNNPQGAGLCAPCTTSAECGGEGDECTLIGGGSFCTTACTTNTDCPSGYECAQATLRSPLQCLPIANRCEGCLLPSQACQNGQICNLDSLTCVSPRANCETCSTDEQCVGGGRCYSTDGIQVCGQPCATAADCGADFECNDIRGARVCVSTNACGLDVGDCRNPPTCGGDLPILNRDFCQCVECGANVDCGNGQVCSSTGRCLQASQTCQNGADCSAPTQFCQGGYCVQCFSNTDCSGSPGTQCIRGACQTCNCDPGFSCDASGRCIENPNGGQCTSDADCATVDGLGMPVQGSCQSGTCYTPGVCGASDSFNSSCPSPTSCENITVFGIIPVDVCTGCNIAGGDCRPGETCQLSTDSASGTACVGPLPF